MPRKGENIYKRKDGRWEGRYQKCKDPDGKAIYGYVYARSYRDVKAKLAEAIRSKQSIPEESTEKNVLLFEIFALEWFDVRKTQIKLSTQNKYWNTLSSYILPLLGKRPLNTLTHDCIECYCNTLLSTGGSKGTGLSPKTVSDVLSIIRSILQYAGKKEVQIACDAKAIRIKKEVKNMRVLSRSEQDRLCQYLYANPDSYNIGILVSLFTGLRVGEICALRWEDISLDEQTIYIHHTMQRVQDRSSEKSKTRVIVTTPKSACSIRSIPLPANLVRFISSNISERTGYFLTGNNANFVEPRTMQNRLRKVLSASSIEPANYHALRHTFATRCIELGFDVKSLSEILGHASVNITMNLYVHPSMELKKSNMKRLSELLAVK